MVGMSYGPLGAAAAATRHGTELGTYRRVIERTFAWLHGFRRPAHSLGTPGRHPGIGIDLWLFDCLPDVAAGGGSFV